MRNKYLIIGVLVMVLFALQGCSNTKENDETDEGTVAAAESGGASGKVYILNYKPEDSSMLSDEVLPAFTEETGIEASVITAAAGSYAQTMKSEMAKNEAPTLFAVNNMPTLRSYKEYCLDLTDTEFYQRLTDKSLALTDGDGISAVPYTIEGFGIIANKRIIEEYCQAENAKISAIDEINNFETLKAVAEDMQMKKDELGIQGAFASTSFSPGEDWRWTNHLANLPLYYEFKDAGVEYSETLSGKYIGNFKNIFDLYSDNSCTQKGVLSSKSVEDAMAEFALEEVAFAQNGSWAWSSIAENNPDMSSDDLTFLPIYIGAEGEEKQGLCVGTEANWAVNAKSSKEDQEATLAFLDWLFTSETGKDYCANKLGWLCPFSSFGEDETPNDPLARSVLEYSSSGKITVPWSFRYIPSSEWNSVLSAALLEYVQGTKEWSAVEVAFIDNWAAEYELVENGE